MIVENNVVDATLGLLLSLYEESGEGKIRHFASAVAAMKDAEILKRFLIILRLFREHVRIKYNK